MSIYQPVIDVIKSGSRFLIASHAHPDGDGIGSTIALGKGIEEFGKSAVMFNDDNVPFNLKFLPYTDQIVHKLPDGAKFDATFMVDCSQRERIQGDVAKLSREALGKIVLIDHHKLASPECDICCIDETAAATGEVICRLFKTGGMKITPEIANLLFCTFVVDSGSFRYSNTSSSLMSEAAMLIEAGANPWMISMAMDESNPPSYIKLLQLVLATFEMKNKVAWVVLTQQMLAESGADIDVAGEFINFPRSISGVEVAILFRETRLGDWKISFRSKNSVDVQKISSAFDGGGHAHAAGCTLKGNLALVKDRIFKEVQKYVK